MRTPLISSMDINDRLPRTAVVGSIKVAPTADLFSRALLYPKRIGMLLLVPLWRGCHAEARCAGCACYWRNTSQQTRRLKGRAPGVEYTAAARSLSSSRSFARKPFIRFANGIFSVVAFEFANYEVRPRQVLEVANERVVDRCTAEFTYPLLGLLNSGSRYVTARMGQARNETLTDGIGDDHKDDRDCPRLSLQRSGHRSSESEDHVGLQVYQLFREYAHSINVRRVGIEDHCRPIDSGRDLHEKPQPSPAQRTSISRLPSAQPNSVSPWMNRESQTLALGSFSLKAMSTPTCLMRSSDCARAASAQVAAAPPTIVIKSRRLIRSPRPRVQAAWAECRGRAISRS
jgi:hypothetical protein